MKFLAVIFVSFNLLLFGEYGLSQITITKITSPPVIDGRVNDTIWDSGAKIDEFYQREPNEGEPLSEKTEVFILYDNNAIYFGIKCYQDPETIAAKEMLRGAALKYDDRVHIILDTYLDGRNAYFFEVNPLGSIGDGLISDNGRQMNTNWDGLFVGKSSITEYGWEAELAIPFKTISFDPNSKSWGLFINRMLETKQEWGSWPVANINMPEADISDAGIITGLEGITQGIGLDIVPYAITGYDSERGEKTNFKINGGTDFYYQITPSLKASLSINTDFAETEADARQINLTRFNIRLTEKRNFFLDGSDLFIFGLEGRRTQPPSGQLSPFFSRRMGLDTAGSSIPINCAAKLTGRIDKWNVGMLYINERRESGNINASVARVSYNIGQLSSIGIITTYGNSINDSNNLVTGLDINLATSKFRGNKNVALLLYGLKSTTENIRKNDVAWGALLYYPNDFINFRLGHQQIGENFFTGLGFVPRNNIKEYWGNITVGPRINKLGIRQYSIGLGFSYITEFNDRLQTQLIEFNPIGIRFNSGDEFDYSITLRSENLDKDFNIYSDYIIPANEYTWWENQFSLETSGSRDIFGSLEYTFSDFFTGRKNSVNLALNWKVFVPVFIAGAVTIDKVNLPEGDFRADIFQFNVNLLFSPNVTLYNLLQYDSQSSTIGLQTRFRWILKPGNEILLIWNSGYSRPYENLVINENALRFKIKYNIRF